MQVMERATTTPNAPIPTWFGVGGGADSLAAPRSIDALRDLVATARSREEPVRILGDGANLLVEDAGVDGLVLSLSALNEVRRESGGVNDAQVALRVGAGVNLPRLIVETVRDGLAGLETLAGVPATLGGAVAMNAGGSFGQIADVVDRVHVLSFDGSSRWLSRADIAFSYRRSGLEGAIVLEADLRLTRAEGAAGAALRERLKEIMALKKKSQPMGERSAGCFWKNPAAPRDWSGHRSPDGSRIGAGWLIDQAGLKGLRVGGASVSAVHANFVVTDHGADGAPKCSAADVLALMREVRRRVQDRWGVTLEPEVVLWRRGEWAAHTGGRATL